MAETDFLSVPSFQPASASEPALIDPVIGDLVSPALPFARPIPNPNPQGAAPHPRKGLLATPWVRALALALFIYLVVFLYDSAYFLGNVVTASSEALAATAGILIGVSFVLSALTYFFNFLDKELHYRKQYGLMGFFVALLYCFTLMARFPEKYAVGLLARLSEPEVVLGLIAMGILAFMAVISHPIGMKKLGRWWRPCLRLGYVAYGMLILRAEILEHQIWANWLSSFRGLPPPRLLLSIFALSVIALRIEMQLVLWLKKFLAKKAGSN